jgi:hypothetical protein
MNSRYPSRDSTLFIKNMGSFMAFGISRRCRSIAADICRLITPGLLVSLTLCSTAAYAQNPALGGGQRHREIQPTCPIGSILVNGRCTIPEVQQQCPPGTIGAYPVCRPAVQSFCPQGTIGVFPNCRPTLNRPPPLDEQLRVPSIQPPPPEVRIP